MASSELARATNTFHGVLMSVSHRTPLTGRFGSSTAASSATKSGHCHSHPVSCRPSDPSDDRFCTSEPLRTSTPEFPLASSLSGHSFTIFRGSQRVALNSAHFHKWERARMAPVRPPARERDPRIRPTSARPVLSFAAGLFKTLGLAHMLHFKQRLQDRIRIEPSSYWRSHPLWATASVRGLAAEVPSPLRSLLNATFPHAPLASVGSAAGPSPFTRRY
ncbi:hypothetical protein JTE90_012048 [Oedothorax gibbosus]|uniref:Uncharacterized protein n=1 Tax=Oedothorax gibbosus TaxID=931172 RepID=A0AAV6TDZ1_9ARAC|nr:hypothetical protein JTE90_012048 [Oedothorax gibbosus]